METTTRNNPKRKKTNISPEQKEILRRYKKNGLTGVGVNHQQQIKDAARETGLPEKAVSKWVHNVDRKPGTKKRNGPTCRMKKGPSGFNLYCSEVGSNPKYKVDRLKRWSGGWWELPSEERSKFEMKAKACRERDFSDLRGSERQQAIETTCRSIEQNFESLQKLGANGLSVVSTGNEVLTCASGQGKPVLETNLVRLETSLYVGGQQQTKDVPNEEDLREKYKKKMNGLYTAFCGTGKTKSFPYTPYQQGKAQFRLGGLPAQVIIKKPKDILMHHLKAVMSGDITLVSITDNDEPVPSEPVSMTDPEPVPTQPVPTPKPVEDEQLSSETCVTDSTIEGVWTTLPDAGDQLTIATGEGFSSTEVPLEDIHGNIVGVCEIECNSTDCGEIVCATDIQPAEAVIQRLLKEHNVNAEEKKKPKKKKPNKEIDDQRVNTEEYQEPKKKKTEKKLTNHSVNTEENNKPTKKMNDKENTNQSVNMKENNKPKKKKNEKKITDFFGQHN